MTDNITTVAGRARLDPRPDPYWSKISTGNFVGFRTAGTWSARHRNDEGKQVFKALGDLGEHPDHLRYDRAVAAAREWFDHLSDGGSTKVITVGDAARHYIAELKADKRDGVAAHSAAQLEKHVHSHRIARIELGKLKAKDVVNWRRDLRDKPTPQGKARAGSTLNRSSNLLRAVLNLAKDDGYATTDRAWKAALAKVGKDEKSGGIYLDRDQRRELLAHITSDEARLFFEALTLIPVRPGAMAALVAGNFDRRTSILHIIEDKANGDRKVQLKGTAAAFFTAQCKGKLPAAPMFVNSANTPWDRDSWSYQFRVAANAANLPVGSGTYDLRHSGITDLVVDGVATLTIAKWAGTSVAQIESNYFHHLPEHGADALERLAL